VKNILFLFHSVHEVIQLKGSVYVRKFFSAKNEVLNPEVFSCIKEYIFLH
jgi:hypothetical protein